mmetsp:Transcript_3702/g.5385  ORF Transcript_3702/g.5385 Transcript_3702/m.5385 type:complete len:266 (-) Transcript_3702:43-840(-)
MYYNRQNSERSTTGTGVCLCFAFGLALFATVSPYWIYQSAWYGWGASSTLGSGVYVVSSSKGTTPCGWGGWSRCTVYNQWNGFSKFNDTVCTGDLWFHVGQRGFCSGFQGSSYSTPREIRYLQGLSVSATVIFFISSITAFVSPHAGGGKLGYISGFLAIAGMSCAIGAFAVANTYSYFQSFSGPGGYLLLLAPDSASGSCGGDCAVASRQVYMYWGPAFWATVVSAIISFGSSVVLCISAHKLDDDDLEGDYGTGKEAYAPTQA